MKNDLLSIIVPVYRQEKTIAADLRTLSTQLKNLGFSYELIVVVDGEVDQSEKIIRKLHLPQTKVIGYPTNHGKGYAVRFGMAQSVGNIIGFIDSGGDINANALGLMLEEMKFRSADIIIGSKLHPASKVSYPIARRIMSWSYRLLVKILFGLNIRDSQVGLKIYRRKILEEVLPRLLVKRFAFDIEILAVAHRLGYTKIYEAPIELDFSKASSITSWNFWQIIFKTLWDTAAVFYRLKIKHFYDDTNQRKWRYDPELNFRINIG